MFGRHKITNRRKDKMNVMKKVFALACTAAFVLASCQEESFEGRMDPDNYFVSKTVTSGELTEHKNFELIPA